jgi:beta-mannosidase
VNGVPFFAKGANWIPADTFVTRPTETDYRRLLVAARDVHMNMLRVWGGGIYEPDIFYDICDELGLCVWQDFMFACSTYPTFDSAFMDNVKAEAQDAVGRIRNHACLALWCGNNELEQGLVADEWTATTMSWSDYGLLFDDLLKQVVTDLAPQTDYWPSSPHSPHIDRADWRNPNYGDAHNWQVWHGREPFEFFRTCNHRFVSEFGFQSFPEPRTVQTYTQPQDRNITSFIMEHHQRSMIGNSTIVHYMTDWFRLPTSFDMMLWLSQILQGLGIKYAVEHWRRAMPRTMGALYWQINDCWPVASWSSIDYFGRWKALHYMAKRFFAPLLVSGVEDIEAGTVDVYVTSDLGEDQSAQIRWNLTDLDGVTLSEGTDEVSLRGRQSQHVQTLDFSQQIDSYGKRNLLLWLSLCVAGEQVSSNLITFAKSKHLELRDPGFATDVRQDGENFKLTLTVERPALYAWISFCEFDAKLSDNFVHLLPGQPFEITISGLPENTSLATVREQLKVYSLTDTYFSE